MKVVAVIPTYNGHDYLAKLIPVLLKQKFYKIYILDDASTDDSQQLYKRYPQLTVIYGHKNVGPVANKNRLLGQDLGDLVFYLDDDMRLDTNNIVNHLTKLFSEHQKLGILGVKVKDNKGKMYNFHFHQESNPLFRPVENLFTSNKMNFKDFRSDFLQVAWVLEGACAIRSQVLKELNGFDERFKRYQEGPDICRRAILAGYEVALTSLIEATHIRHLKALRPSHYPVFLSSSLKWYWKHTRFNPLSNPSSVKNRRP